MTQRTGISLTYSTSISTNKFVDFYIRQELVASRDVTTEMFADCNKRISISGLLFNTNMLFFKNFRICCSDDIVVQSPRISVESLSQPLVVIVWNVALTITSMKDLYDSVFTLASMKYGLKFLGDHEMWLQYRGKPLSRAKPLEAYNIHAHAPIEVRFSSLLGGSSNVEDMLPISESVRIERLLLNSTSDRLYLQGDDTYDASTAANFKIFQQTLERLFQGLGPDFHLGDTILNLVDHFQVSLWTLKKVESEDDFIMWLRTTYRCLTGFSSLVWIRKTVDSLLSSCVQGEDDTPFVYKLRGLFDMSQKAIDAPLFKKLQSIYSYMLVHGVLKPLGLELSDEQFTRIEQRNYARGYGDKVGFVMSVIDTTIFILEKAYEFKKTGDICVFVHGDKQYADWAVKCDKLIALAPFTGNLEAHGTSYFEFMADVTDIIERGQAYVKFTTSRGDFEGMAIKSKLAKLMLIKNTEVTKRASLQERPAPFGVLIAGGSSVAKSSFTKMLFYYYGALFKLPTDPHYKYTRNCLEEYWSNFVTSMWCIHMDDVAFLLPSKTTEVDPSLKEIIMIGNNVACNPAQAALDDKGKTPVRAELLLATTNSVDLNAQEYFSCPLAVRRRLPFVIQVEPKPEFRHANGVFIDPAKLTQPTDGFPDFWNITVSKVTPFQEGKRELARLEVVGEYSDVHEFLKHFGECAIEHKKNQSRAMSCDTYMGEIKVCSKCLKPESKCDCMKVQADELIELEYVPTEWPSRQTWSEWFLNTYCAMYTWWFSFWFHLSIVQWTLRFEVVQKFVYRYCLARLCGSAQIKYLGILNSIQAMPAKWQKLAKITGMLAVAMASAGVAYYGYKTLRKSKQETTRKTQQDLAKDIFASCPEGVEKAEYVFENGQSKVTFTVPTSTNFDAHVEMTEKIEKSHEVEDNVCDLQGGHVIVHPEDQLKKEQRNNVWYNPTVELTKFDVPVASQSLAGCDPQTVRDILSRNCLFIEVRYVRDGERRVSRMCGVMYKSVYCVVPHHLFPQDQETYKVTVIRTPVVDGVNGNIEFELQKSEIVFNRAKEVALFRVTGVPPSKDISKFWCETDVIVSRACVVRRSSAGQAELLDAHGLIGPQIQPVPALGVNLPLYAGRISEETKNGDCGALYVAITPRGPVIVGIHLLGRGCSVGVLHVLKQDIEGMIQEIDEPTEVPLTIQGEGEPMLSCSIKTHILGPLHHRSMVRYMEKGSAHMYGTFQGFRNKPKSRVTATPLQKEFLEHYQTQVGYDKPCMTGWEPWSKNVVEMVKPSYTYNREILAEAADAFYEDIVRDLPAGWKSELLVLSDKAAVNGIPGVMYIDAMNFGSSMGFPWNCSKQAFLIPDPDEQRPDAKNFDAEWWARVRVIEEKYARGERAYPVFMGHLKDEATPEKKCRIKKTRLFTGAPSDWSCVVRKNLLSFVRLLQKNRYVFEAGVGCVAQSSEWGDIHKYLTAFGSDRIVAGDYGKFDKHMASDFILTAFQIIARLHKCAGLPDEVIRTIMGIGFDTSFPLCNINADLIEFFGTNPSGHPLTVVINSIVNALYMRYVYKMLNPAQECASFKKNVHLYTYGDDNIMGVARDADWFNHTAIQSALAKIGVEYTMAEKEAASVPFISIGDCQFLKRKWRFEEEVNNYVCPLDEESIIKSLTVWVPSSTICKEKQMVAVMSSACREYFFYGKQKFNEKRDLFLSLTAEFPYSCYVEDSTFPTWDQLVERFHIASTQEAST